MDRESRILSVRADVESQAEVFACRAADRDDLCQVGWVAVVAALDRFDRNAGATWRTFASRCATHAMLNYIKSESRYYDRISDWGVRVVLARDNADDEATVARRYEEVLSRLPTEDREVLQIAVTDVSRFHGGARGQRLRRARQKFLAAWLAA